MNLFTKFLKKNIEDTKRSYFNTLITNSTNKIKATWNIVNSMTGKKSPQDGIHTLNRYANVTSD